MHDAVTTTSNGMTLPPLQAPIGDPKDIFVLKSKDRSPHIKAAGIRALKSDERTQDCMLMPDKEVSPEVLKKFKAFTMPEPGAMRVFYGYAFDPERKLARKLRHGLCTKDTTSCKEILRPPLKTNFQKKLVDIKEKIYASENRMPLGRSCQQPLFVPKNLKSSVEIFGKPLDKSDNLYNVVNPPLTYSEVMEVAKMGHEMYVYTHKDFNPGEQVKRSYSSPQFNSQKRFGETISHWNDGRLTKQAMNWATHTEDRNNARIVPKSLDAFRERTQPQLAEPLDPIKDTLLVPADHCFGCALPCDGYGVKDLMHHGCPLQNIKDPLHTRGLLMSTRRFLRHRMFKLFDDLLSNLTQCDKDGVGRLPVTIVMDLCLEYNLPVDFCVLGALLQNCNPGDGMIKYKDFVDFINWTKPLPNFDEFPIREASLMDEVNGPHLNVIPEENKKSCFHTEKPIVAINPNLFKTTNSEINAVVGKVSTKDWKKCGIPSIRHDLVPPKKRPIDSRMSYGDEGTSRDLVNPTIFACHGIFTKDMTAPRSFKEIKEIFHNIGFKYDSESLEGFYNELRKQDPNGEVSIESFWYRLNTLPPDHQACYP